MMEYDFPAINAQMCHALQDLPVQWVKTDNELYDLIDKIDSLDRVALDTEFIKRNTYFPILALVQVNTGKAIYLVDAPRLDLTEFWQALAEVPQMIWYACGEDLGIFYLLAQCPPLTNVIDVQIGIAYLTGQLQMGYARALDLVLGISLDKSESKSDWLARPLSERQERYAADDVRYLLLLSDVVSEVLAKKNLSAFVKEDTDDYAKELYQAQHIPDNQLYIEYLSPHYHSEQIVVLQAVVAWRESLARSTNQPRSFIISKQALREIITTMPITIKTLAYTTINRGSLRLYGKEIIRIIQEAKNLPAHQHPPMPPPNFITKDRPYQKDLDVAIKKQAAHWQIPSELLLKNRWLSALLVVAMTDDERMFPEGMKGYRYDWARQQVLPILRQYKQEILLALSKTEAEN